MTTFIARDGAVIGEYPRAALDQLARSGELESTDHYWQEGMEDWLPLPELLGPAVWQPAEAAIPAQPIDSHGLDEAAEPAPFPIRRVAAIAGASAAFVLIGGLLIYFSTSSPTIPERTSLNPTVSPAFPLAEGATEIEIRDKAAADLRQRLEQLPARATPPLNTFYYDVSVHMTKLLSPRTPWSAAIRGRENVIDPATEQTTRRTEFILTTDYEDGEWVYKHYQASTTNLADFAITEIIEDENTPTPPSLAGVLGLKRKKR